MNRHTVQGLIFTWLFIIILSCFGCGFSARDVEVTLDAGASATEAEQARIAALPGGRIGYVIYDLAKHKTVRSHLMHSGFIPASTTKIFTTLAALEVLGPEFRFETNLLRTGSVRDGVLTGDLILKGGGDPTLAASDLMHQVRCREGWIAPSLEDEVAGENAVSYRTGAQKVCLESELRAEHLERGEGGEDFRGGCGDESAVHEMASNGFMFREVVDYITDSAAGQGGNPCLFRFSSGCTCIQRDLNVAGREAAPETREYDNE